MELRVAAMSENASWTAGLARKIQSGTAGLFSRQIGAMPPSAAKGLKERGGVGVAVGLGLNVGDDGLVISLLGAEERHVVGVADLKLARGQIEGALRRLLCRDSGLQR